MRLSYAAYGSNLHPLRLRERVPSAEFRKCVAIEGWGLRFHKRSKDGSAKCNIVPAKQSVFFAIFDIAAEERVLLDKAEGLGFGYDETAIVVPEYGLCFAYTASKSHIDDRLMPYSWYKELVLCGLEYHRAPQAYLDNVRSIAAEADIDTARSAKNMALAHRIRTSLSPV